MSPSNLQPLTRDEESALVQRALANDLVHDMIGLIFGSKNVATVAGWIPGDLFAVAVPASARLRMPFCVGCGLRTSKTIWLPLDRLT